MFLVCNSLVVFVLQFNCAIQKFILTKKGKWLNFDYKSLWGI